MPKFLEPVALILIGWLLGLLGPSIVDAIRQRKDNKLGRSAIITELEEFATTIATAAYRVRMSQGTLDREFLQEMKAVVEEYPQVVAVSRLQKGVETFLKLDDEQLSALAMHSASPVGVGLALQHYSVPLLDSRVSAFLSFKTPLQRQLLQLRREIALLDGLVDRAEKYLDLTYSVNDHNHQRASDSHASACTEYSKRAMRIVKIIREIRE
ncbi:hypothetical protein [Xanthomonas sp. LMC-A-07]|uniref:hypothetical protein n=1 Tax=Xanthomonas sp. LMC-A-07 TaxID=3040329 RepID=UPI0025526F40|nr:hypothetical protein [Xanthomonas sp. LMC-A-07]